MRCIHSQPPFLPLHSQLKQKKKLKSNEVLWFSGSFSTRVVLHRQRNPSLVPLRLNATSAIFTSFVPAVNSPAETGDITVFLQTSAGLFFLYWVANFLVPDIISKYFEFDKVDEDKKPSDEDPLG